MTDVSFEDADLTDVMFTDGCSLDTVKMPTRGEYLLVEGWKESLTRLLEKATSAEGQAGERLELFLKIYKRKNNSQDQTILNFNDVEAIVGQELADIVWAELGGARHTS
jgi:hypothetical protein